MSTWTVVVCDVCFVRNARWVKHFASFELDIELSGENIDIHLKRRETSQTCSSSRYFHANSSNQTWTPNHWAPIKYFGNEIMIASSRSTSSSENYANRFSSCICPKGRSTYFCAPKFLKLRFRSYWIDALQSCVIALYVSVNTCYLLRFAFDTNITNLSEIPVECYGRE